MGSGGCGREVSWVLRVLSRPRVGDLIYQPWLNNKIGATKYLFYRPPDIVAELLPEMNRLKLLPGARAAMLRSIRCCINLWGLRKQGHILERLKASPVPLMTVWGANDIIIPVSHAEAVRRDLPESVVRIIPECGHWPQMEKPGQFNPMLTGFLSGDPTLEPQQQS